MLCFIYGTYIKKEIVFICMYLYVCICMYACIYNCMFVGDRAREGGRNLREVGDSDCNGIMCSKRTKVEAH